MRQKSNLSAVVPKKVRARFKGGKLSNTALVASYTAGILVLAGVGVLFQNATVGNLLILVFGIVSIATFVNGLEIIKMMVVTLICAMILTMTANHKLANVFAQYSFLFLIIAMVNILREEWQLIRKTVDK